MKKVFVIGLDCATPQLIFERYRPVLPNLSRLMDHGVYGKLRSCHPPITVPAWTCMMTGRTPGSLGFYGFRNRKDYTYDGLTFATATAVNEPAVWDILGQAGKKVICLSVPQTYPPKPVNGLLVSCFLTPGLESQYTYPPDLRNEIQSVIGDYVFDVEEFRTEDKDKILASIYEMTDKRFRLAEHFLKNKPWDFFMLVEIGVDRIHHGFWRHMDPNHPKYVPGNPYENVIRDYYIDVDHKIGRLLEMLDQDTVVLVVSDHGAKSMKGGICINEFLVREGYLKLKSYPTAITQFKNCQIDWEKTVAWGEGGYYSRVFLNVAGREPSGVIKPERYETVRDELIRKLQGIGDPSGKPIGTNVYRPEDLYSECRGIAPDLIAYFGDLDWRSVGSLGHRDIHTFENDLGPDDANHDWDGIFIYHDSKSSASREMQGLTIYDVAPTILSEFGLEIPAKMVGRPITSSLAGPPGDRSP